MTKRRLTPNQVRAQQVAGEYLGPGVWVDREGALHFSVPEILTHLGIPNTPANRDWLTTFMSETLRTDVPDATVIVQDEGTDG